MVGISRLLATPPWVRLRFEEVAPVHANQCPVARNLDVIVVTVKLSIKPVLELFIFDLMFKDKAAAQESADRHLVVRGSFYDVVE
jgi:hypothetical protein